MRALPEPEGCSAAERPLTPGDPGDPGDLNGTVLERGARVVAIEGGTVWLEAESTASCGGCQSLAACAGKSGPGRKSTRRFALAPSDSMPELRVGERVVVGISQGALLRASATAYALPLLTMLGAGAFAELSGVSDLGTAGVTLLGLALGLLLARGCARFLSSRGDLSPRVLRHLPESPRASAGTP